MQSASGNALPKRVAGPAAPLAKAISTIADETQMLGTAIRYICKFLSTPLGKILEHDTIQDHLVVRAAHGWPEGALTDARVSTGTGSLAGYTLRSRQPVMFEDLPGTRRFTDALVLRKNNVVSTLAITLMVGDRAFGVLSVHDVQRRKFSTADLQFIGAAANAIDARLLALSKIGARKT